MIDNGSFVVEAPCAKKHYDDITPRSFPPDFLANLV